MPKEALHFASNHWFCIVRHARNVKPPCHFQTNNGEGIPECEGGKEEMKVRAKSRLYEAQSSATMQDLKRRYTPSYYVTQREKR